MRVDPKDILTFWFGEEPLAVPTGERLRFWFGGDPATDDLIRRHFGILPSQAAAGACDHWAATPRGRLALLLVLDQFPRNLFRDSAQAYAFDERARAVAAAGLEVGQDRGLSPAERAFFYLPFEHSEQLADQQRSVLLFETLRAEAPPGCEKICEGFLDYARRHLEIIQRFGRFPHRNQALGRLSTAEELTFLSQPGSSF